MLLNEPRPTRAVLILANGQRIALETSLDQTTVGRLLDLIGPRYFAGYILNPNAQSVRDSTNES